MVALRGLLFALFTMALTAIVSLIVVGIINITYRIGHRKKVSGKIQK